MISMTFNSSDLLRGLHNLSARLSDEVAMAGVAGMAKVIYDEAHVRVPVSKSSRTVKGKTYNPGALKAALYRAYSREKGSPISKAYVVSWNGRKAPHGHLVEFGHWQTMAWGKVLKNPKWVPAHPFLRPATAAMPQAFDAARRRMTEQLTKVLA